MKVISHRGWWLTPEEKNTEVAFRRSFEAGFGTETDVRDHNGRLVIAHDMPTGKELPFSEFLALYRESCAGDLPLALNIKADGLGALLAQQVAAAGLAAWFTFDMSVPDFMVQHQLGLPAYTRRSDVECLPVLETLASGVWLDSFVDRPLDVAFLAEAAAVKKPVCLVSAELHKRSHLTQWATLRQFLSQPSAGSNLTLCTDIPDAAVTYFKEVL